MCLDSRVCFFLINIIRIWTTGSIRDERCLKPAFCVQASIRGQHRGQQPPHLPLSAHKAGGGEDASLSLWRLKCELNARCDNGAAMRHVVALSFSNGRNM